MPPFSLQTPSILGVDPSTDATGVANATQSLANTFVQGPMRAAQAGYLGAEQGYKQAQTGVINSQEAAKGQLPQAMADVNNGVPGSISRLATVLAQSGSMAPEQNAAIRLEGLSRGQDGSINQSTADQYNITGGIPAASTSTGLGQEIAGRNQVASIGAGAQMYTADQNLAGTQYTADSNYKKNVYSEDAATGRTKLTEAGAGQRTSMASVNVFDYVAGRPATITLGELNDPANKGRYGQILSPEQTSSNLMRGLPDNQNIAPSGATFCQVSSPLGRRPPTFRPHCPVSSRARVAPRLRPPRLRLPFPEPRPRPPRPPRPRPRAARVDRRPCLAS